MEQIIIKNLSKSYGTLTVLKNVDLTLDRYKTYCLMSLPEQENHFIPYSYGTGKAEWRGYYLECGVRSRDWNWYRCFPFSAHFRCFPGRPALSFFFPLWKMWWWCRKTYFWNFRDFQGWDPHSYVPSSAGRMFKPAGIYLKRGYETTDCDLRALLTKSDMLLLDEPFTGLDEETKIDVIRFLQEYRNNRFLLISTHQKEDVELLKGILITL